MVLLLVSLGRTIKTMISNNYVVVSSQGTAAAGRRAKLRHFWPEKAMAVRLKCNALTLRGLAFPTGNDEMSTLMRDAPGVPQ